jgi:hypothetical protein
MKKPLPPKFTGKADFRTLHDEITFPKTKKYVYKGKIKTGKLTEIFANYSTRSLRCHDMCCNEYKDVDGRYDEQRF